MSRLPVDPAIAGTDRSVASAYLASILPAVIAHYGLDEDAVLAEAGLDPAVLSETGRMVPLVDAMRLFLVILSRTGDPGMGFEIGRQVRARSYQVLGYAILSSEDLGQAIERLMRFEKLAGNLGETTMNRVGDIVRLTWHCPVKGEPARYLTEAAITGWVTFARQLVDAAPAPLRVCFRHAAQVDADRYERHFQCPVEFAADFDGVEVPESFLRLPLSGADPGLSGMMEREAAQLLTDYDSQTNLVNAVRSEIYRLLADGEPTVEQVAGRLQMAERTLQGRLRKQGASFQEVLDGLRRSLAALYMQDARLSLTDIGLLLGFAEQSSFTRAFRRWHGESPARVRQRLAE
mgnify:CR=1 FL=1